MEVKAANEYAVVAVAEPSVIDTCARVLPGLSVNGPPLPTVVRVPEFPAAGMAATGTVAVSGVAPEVIETVAEPAVDARLPVLATTKVTLNVLPAGVVGDTVVAF